MPFYMVHQLLETILWEWLEWNTVRGWFPFKIEKLLLVRFLPGKKILILKYSIAIRWVLCRLAWTHFILILWDLWIVDSESTLHHFSNKPRIVSIVYYELKMLIFARLVAVCGKFCVFSICIFARLYELFFLLFKDFMNIDRSFRGKLTQKFAK